MKNFNYTGLLCLFLLLTGALTAQAQPSNDLCSGAIAISNGQTLSGTTTGASVDNAGFCGTSNTAPGVWYTITGTGGVLTLSTCNQASYDTKISVFSGACGSLSCVGGNDDASGCSGFTSELSVSTTAGTNYYILVHGFGSATGNFDLTASLSTPITNDACSGALPIACGQTVSGSTVGANSDAAPFCGTGSSSAGVWYEFTGNGQGVTASLCSGTSFDSKLRVYTGSCGSLVCEAGNDDACGLQSEVTFSSVQGQTYYILVHGFGSSTGAFNLEMTCIAPPANDDACDAQAVSIGSTTFSNEFATTQTGEVSPGAGTGSSTCNSQDGWCSFGTSLDNSVWFTFTAPPSGCVSIVADGFDSQIAVYEVTDCNDFSTYTELAANDDSGDDIVPSAGSLSAGIDELSCLTPGATYYIQVDGFNGAESDNAELILIDCGGDPLAVDAGLCQTRFVGYAPAEADTNFLKACATGGLAPYTFSWSDPGLFQDDDSTCSNLAVQPGAGTTYTVTVTDARGCSVTADVEVQVIDVTCGNNGNKVQICHYPPGNPNNPQQLCISPNAVAAHLDPANGHSGCHLGPCNNPCLNTNPSVAPPPACVDLIVSVSTDDFANETSWELVDRTTGQTVGSRSFSFGDDFTTFTDTFCVDPRNCYDVTIFDSFGDGICCSFGQGNWSVSFDGTVTNSPSGGNFGGSETISVGNCANKQGAGQAAAAPANELSIVAYPNPTNGQASIKFSSASADQVFIDLYNLSGKRVATLFEGQVEAGKTNVVSADLSQFPNGVYIYRLNSSTATQSGKIQVSH